MANVDRNSSPATRYATQGVYSDPGGHAHLFDDVEPRIDAVSAMARNVVVHYATTDPALPQDSRVDVDLRWIEAILATDQRRHRRPLVDERPIERRVQGCCRDHSLLARYRRDPRLHPGTHIHSISPTGARYRVALMQHSTNRVD